MESESVSVWVVGLISIDDAEAYVEYQKAAIPTVIEAGGRVVAAGAGHTLEGEPFPDGTVIVEFPSKEAALAWYESAAYQAIIGARLRASRASSIVIVPAPGS